MIPYGRQDLDESDIRAVLDVLKSDYLTMGPVVEAFEEELKNWTGGVPVVAVSSGTAALHSAYAAAGIGPGEEVITPPITFVATQAALLHLGAIPVFADVQHETANIDPACVEAAITSRTSAIVAVDYAGNPADMDSLRALADKYGLLLFEDAAHSLGSVYKGRAVGSLADVTTFSFFPTKSITAGEGGAVVSPHPEILARARQFSRQGLVRDPLQFSITSEGPWHQEVHTVGLNYRLSEIHAALGLSQLSRLKEFRARRAEIKTTYDIGFEPHGDLCIPQQTNATIPMWHLYPLRVPPGVRAETYSELRRRGIGVQVNYLPAYRHPALQTFADPRDFPVSEAFYSRELSLPIHTKLSNLDVTFISDAVIEVLRNSKSIP